MADSASPPAEQIPTDAPAAAPSSTDAATVKSTEDKPKDTPDASSKDTPPKYLMASERNVLYKYRSWTYNFAIGAISKDAIADNSRLGIDIKKYPVLNSSGKGTSGMGINPDFASSKGMSLGLVKGIVNGFNKNSPGRFDMYIDNVEIDGIVNAGSPETGLSISTKILFDVVEPYSMNGFLEALQVAAVAAGYADYTSGAFAIRVQFMGWPDDSGNSSRPEVIPSSTRYFMIKITGVTVDVTESGTKYKVNCVPLPQMAYANTTNSSKQDFKITGNTIGEVLIDYFKQLNKAEADTRKAATADQPTSYTWFEISAPKFSVPGGASQDTKGARLFSPNPRWTVDTSKQNTDILKVEMNDRLKSPNVQPMAAPGEKATPKSAFTFAANSNIHDNIAAIVRDSTYVRNLLTPESLDKAKKGDGMLTYFNVRTELEYREYDTVSAHNFKTVRYVLEPYKIHYSQVPGQQIASDPLTSLKKKIKKEYNYLYTGKNLDITKFNLTFNNLFFTAMPKAMGNVLQSQGAATAALDNKTTVQETKKTTEGAEASRGGVPSVPTDRTADSNKTVTSGANAGLNQQDPYYMLAKEMHKAIIEGVDNIVINLTILGDPYFLVTGGMGNNDLKLIEPMKTADGQAPYTQGNIYIYLTFRNPTDINPSTGLLNFDNKLIPYSGVFQVTQLKNHFKDGLFIQDLKAIRVKGQVLSGSPITPPNNKTKAMPGAQVTKDSAKNILTSGIRLPDLNLANLLSRGLPGVGLPGVPVNFTNVFSSLPSPSELLTKASGAVTAAAAGASNIFSSSPVTGINALASGTRLAAAGLSSPTNPIGASVGAIGNTMNSITNIPTAATNLADSVATQATQLVSTVEAAGAKLVTDVKALGNDITTAVGGIGDKINSLQNPFTSDPTALAAKFGIDPAQLSGLSDNLQSQVTAQLAKLNELVPKDTDIQGLIKQGVSFASITGDKLINLPVLQPLVTAEKTVLNPDAITNIIKDPMFGKTSPFGQLSAGVTGLGASFGELQDKLAGAQKQLGAAVAGVAGLPASVADAASGAAQAAGLGLGSVESNIASIQSIVQTKLNAETIASAVPVQFGSLQNTSPLITLVQDTNKGII